MPEDITRLGIDASQPRNELEKLAKTVDKYSKALLNLAKATTRTNVEQEQVDDILKKVATVAESAAAKFRDLALAQREVAIESAKLSKINLTPLSGKALDNERKRARLAKETALAEQKAAERRTRNTGARALLERRITTPEARKTASLQEITNFDRSLDEFQSKVAKSKLSLSEIGGIVENLGGKYTGSARQIRDAAVQVVKANASLSKSFLNENQKLFAGQQAQQREPTTINPFPGTQFRQEAKQSSRVAREQDLRNVVRGAKDAENALKGADSAAKGFDISLSALGKIAFTQFALSGLFKLTGAFSSAISAAKDYEVQLALIQTISREFASRDLDEVSAQIRGISEAFGLPIADVAQGLYDTLSNQVGTAAESIQFLGDAAVFAKAANLSLADSGNLLAGVIKSYGLAAGSAAELSGKLFAAIDVGRITGDELANTLGRVTGLARETGISIDEVLAALASFTIEGIDAGEAMTLLSNVMLKLIKPTEALKKEFRQLGVGSIELAIQADGLQPTLTRITEAGGQSAEAVGELFNQIRGTRGVLGLVGKSADNYAKALDEITKANAETAKSAQELIAATSGDLLKRQAAELEGLLVDGFGRPVIKTFTQIIESIGGVKVALTALSVAAGVAALAATAKMIPALKSMSAEFLKTNLSANQLKATMLGLQAISIVGTFLAMKAAAEQAGDAFKDWRSSLKAANESIRVFTATREAQFTEDLASLKAANKERLASLDSVVKKSNVLFGQLQQQYSKDLQDATRFQELTNSSLERQLNKRVSIAQSLVSELQRVQENAAESARETQKTILGLEFERGQGEFERSIRELPQEKQARALVSRSQQLLDAAKEAFAKGNKELGDELLQTGSQLVNQAADIDISKQAAVNNYYKQRIGILKQIEAEEQKKARLAAQEEERVAALADDLARQVQILQSTPLIQDGEDPQSKVVEERLAARQAAIKNIQDDLKGIKGVDLSKILDSTRLNLLKRQLEAGIVDPITGGFGQLDQIVGEQYNSIISKLSRATDAVPIEVKIAFKDQTGRPFDPISGPEQFAQNMAKAAAQIRKELAATEDLPGLNRDIDIASFQTRAATEAARGVVRDNGASRETQRLSEAVFAQIITAVQQANTGTTEGLKASQETLAELIKKQAVFQAGADRRDPKDLSGEAVAEKAISRLLNSAVANVQTIIESQAKAIPLREVANSADNAKVKTDEMATAIDAATTKVNSFGGALDAGFQRFLQQQGQKFAVGGTAGPDTLLSRLTPGEFVMNPRASQAFRPLLHALNNAAIPRFAAGGDTINVGDVNFNISTSRPEKINARTLAAQFTREIRKGTLK